MACRAPRRRSRRDLTERGGAPAKAGAPPDFPPRDNGCYSLETRTVFGLVHRGPRSKVASGRVMKASGPALCSPLKGVVPVKPHAAASAGSLNQKPTWKVFVGSRPTAGSNPKI